MAMAMVICSQRKRALCDVPIRVTSSEIYPLSCTMVCSLRKSLLVIGHFSDGDIRFCGDITGPIWIKCG
jgi:hypothetical protein